MSNRSAILGASLLLLALACGDDQKPAEADQLWSKIQAEGYRSFARVPGYPERRRSSAPHGDHVDIYMNRIAADVLATGSEVPAWPDGTLFVKDGFHDDGSLDVVTAMEKRSGEWFWAEWSAEGESTYSGAPSVCLDCHGVGSDFARAVSLP